MVSVRIAVRVMLGFGLESRSDETFFFGFFLFSWKYSDFLMFDARKEVLYGRYIYNVSDINIFNADLIL